MLAALVSLRLGYAKCLSREFEPFPFIGEPHRGEESVELQIDEGKDCLRGVGNEDRVQNPLRLGPVHAETPTSDNGRGIDLAESNAPYRLGSGFDGVDGHGEQDRHDNHCKRQGSQYECPTPARDRRTPFSALEVPALGFNVAVEAPSFPSNHVSFGKKTSSSGGFVFMVEKRLDGVANGDDWVVAQSQSDKEHDTTFTALQMMTTLTMGTFPE